MNTSYPTYFLFFDIFGFVLLFAFALVMLKCTYDILVQIVDIIRFILIPMVKRLCAKQSVRDATFAIVFFICGHIMFLFFAGIGWLMGVTGLQAIGYGADVSHIEGYIAILISSIAGIVIEVCMFSTISDAIRRA